LYSEGSRRLPRIGGLGEINALVNISQLFYFLQMSKPFFITSVRQLLVIASPGREDLVDAVGVLGPCTITELARFVGRSRNGLYYQVKALRDCGLLLESRRSGEGKKATAYYDVPGRPMVVRFNLGTERTRKAVIALARIRLRSAARGFVRACRPDVATVEGPTRNLWVARWKGWLSNRELEEANTHLERLIELLRHRAGAVSAKRKLHEFTFALAPVVPAGRKPTSGMGSRPTRVAPAANPKSRRSGLAKRGVRGLAH
jgi:predicted transcriptional regulator